MKQILVRVDDDLHARLRAEAAQSGRSMNAVLNDAIRRILVAPAQSERQRVRTRARALKVLTLPTPAAPVDQTQWLATQETLRDRGTMLDSLLDEQRSEH